MKIGLETAKLEVRLVRSSTSELDAGFLGDLDLPLGLVALFLVDMISLAAVSSSRSSTSDSLTSVSSWVPWVPIVSSLELSSLL